MRQDSVILGLFFGVLIMLPYAILFFRKHREMPPLGKLLYIVMAGAASASAIEVLLILWVQPAKEFGVLESHRATIGLGALAVIWTSIDTVYNIYQSIGATPKKF